MSTRSLISVEKNGVIFTSYCHFDGYLTGVGKDLAENYDSQEAAEKLVMGGDMRSVEPDLLDIYRYEGGMGPRIMKGSDIPPSYYNCGQEYEYLFQDGSWVYREEGTRDWYSVAHELYRIFEDVE